MTTYIPEEKIGMIFRKVFPVGGIIFTNGATAFARAIEAAAIQHYRDSLAGEVVLPELPERYTTHSDQITGHVFCDLFTKAKMQDYARQAIADDRAKVEPMDEVAHRFAHPLALELECVLADRNANWDRAMNLIGEYRSAMNAIHEQHSPTRMGEPLLAAASDPKDPE